MVEIVSVQNRYSFADREWDYVLEFCEQKNIAFIPWSPIGGGKKAHAVLEEVAKSMQAPPQQVALAWLLKRSPVMLPIPGTSTVKHLEENVAAAGLQLSEADYKKLSDLKPEPMSLRDLVFI